MKIKNLAIRNFKSFANHTNKIEDEVRQLSDFNMLYGYNNSGKSNLLKFLNLIFQPKNDIQRIRVNGEDIQRQSTSAFWKGLIDDSGFLFHKNDRSKPIEFRFLIVVEHNELKKGFQNFDDLKKDFLSTTHSYATFDISGEIRAVDDFHTSEIILNEVKLNSKKIYAIDANGKVTYFEKPVRAKSPLLNDATAFNQLMAIFDGLICFLDNSRFFNTETVDHQSTKLTSAGFKNWLYHLYLDPTRYKMFSELVNFIRDNKVAAKAGDLDIFKSVEKNSPFSDFKPEFSMSAKNEIEIMLSVGKDRLPLASFGTGIQQLLYILSQVYMTTSRILLIEELEMNFSPKYQQELLQILRDLITEKKIDQVFFTTHSEHFTVRNDFSIYEITMNGGVSTIKKVRSRSKLFFKPS